MNVEAEPAVRERRAGLLVTGHEPRWVPGEAQHRCDRARLAAYAGVHGGNVQHVLPGERHAWTLQRGCSQVTHERSSPALFARRIVRCSSHSRHFSQFGPCRFREAILRRQSLHAASLGNARGPPSPDPPASTVSARASMAAGCRAPIDRHEVSSDVGPIGSAEEQGGPGDVP